MIPVDLEDCFKIIKMELSPSEINKIMSMKIEELCRLHHSLGRWIRNNWSLWGEEGALKDYFNNIGLHHADDMSGLIIESFWHHLRNEPLEIEKQIKEYQDFWAKTENK